MKGKRTYRAYVVEFGQPGCLPSSQAFFTNKKEAREYIMQDAPIRREFLSASEYQYARDHYMDGVRMEAYEFKTRAARDNFIAAIVEGDIF